MLEIYNEDQMRFWLKKFSYEKELEDLKKLCKETLFDKFPQRLNLIRCLWFKDLGETYGTCSVSKGFNEFRGCRVADISINIFHLLYTPDKITKYVLPHEYCHAIGFWEHDKEFKQAFKLLTGLVHPDYTDDFIAPRSVCKILLEEKASCQP